MVNHRWWRWFTVWFSPGFGVVAAYRIDRAGYLIFKDVWVLGRVLLFPIFLVLRLLGASCEIHYRADIGEGLQVLHPTLGIVISGDVVAGRALLLTGGNCIGVRGGIDRRPFILGDGVSLGVNAVILGPVLVGDRAQIGAGAVVVRDVRADEVVVGVPARPVIVEQT